MIRIDKTQPVGLFDMRNVFSTEGFIGRSYNGYETRPQQAQMADAVQKAFFDSRHLAVEAGTGVGKSFAYLVPSIEQVYLHAGRVLISTYTITLQEQLINKDIPFLAEIMPTSFTAVLAKGRGNYLCIRRLAFAMRRQRGLFDKFMSELETLNDWAAKTKDGSLSDMRSLPSSSVWDTVKSEHGNCRGRKCPHFSDCFYQRARRRLESADIIVANHAIVFSDLILKEDGAKLLPDYRFVVIDEAQNIEHVAEEQFGINISNSRVKFLLNGLYNHRTHRGLLARTDDEKAIKLVKQTARQAQEFFKQVREWFDINSKDNNGRCYKNFVHENLTGFLKSLRSELLRLAKGSDDEDEKFELTRYIDRCASLCLELNSFLQQKNEDYVYWVDISKAGRNNTILKSAPIDVGPDIRRYLLEKFDSVVLTSATLSTEPKDNKSGFEFFANSVGLTDFDALKLGSPFDYQTQLTLYIEKNLPGPNEGSFVPQASEKIKKYLLQTQGRAFVLFTSYSMLDQMAASLSDWLASNNIELLQQGAGLERNVLLKRFKKSPKAVLFGTDSFSQGVDVPGQSLSNVIIVRLPFAVPDKPLLAGRLEQIRQQGGNPFFDYQLPSAIIKFKQSFGRLIRSKNDTGIVVVLDSRIVNKRYGRKFLDALPDCSIQIVKKE
ncbi:MAG: ATP-dependent DNA helicase [Planctomycetota bacterium]|jgi:ATP-dependent DNA helicase DinG